VSANAATIDTAIGLAVVELNAAIAALATDIDAALGIATTTIIGAISVQTADLLSAINSAKFVLPGPAFIRYNTRYQMDTNYNTGTLPAPYDSVSFEDRANGRTGVVLDTNNLGLRFHQGSIRSVGFSLTSIELQFPAVIPTGAFQFTSGSTYYLIVGELYNST